MHDQLSKICPECRGYILGNYKNCPYCGYYFKFRKRRLGFYRVLFMIFSILMLIALLIKGTSDASYRKIQPYIDREKIKHI